MFLADLIYSVDFRDIAGDQLRRFRLLKDLATRPCIVLSSRVWYPERKSVV